MNKRVSFYESFTINVNEFAWKLILDKVPIFTFTHGMIQCMQEVYARFGHFFWTFHVYREHVVWGHRLATTTVRKVPLTG